MHTSFQDWEDKLLVQIAFQFEREGLRITWSYVARRMAKTKRKGTELRMRLASLKRTYGKTIANFPRCFFGGVKPLSLWTHSPRSQPAMTALPAVSSSHRPTTTVHLSQRLATTTLVTSPASPSPQFLSSATSSAVSPTVIPSPASAIVPLQPRRSISAGTKKSSVLELPEAITVLSTMFGEISARDVRQQAGQMHGNAGEVLPAGIAALINAMGPVDGRHIFLDVGAGIGNVIAQFALTTDVKACIGVELRAELCKLGRERMETYSRKYPLLERVSMIAADAQDVALSSKEPMCRATHIFANNFLFEEPAKLVIARELCSMTEARVVAVSCLVCPRHRHTCKQPFCLRWRLVRKLGVPCSWKSTPHCIFIYQRK